MKQRLEITSAGEVLYDRRVDSRFADVTIEIDEVDAALVTRLFAADSCLA